MSPNDKILKLYDQSVIIPPDEYVPGVETVDFKVFSGSRILLTLHVKNIDIGANVQIEVLNSFTVDNPAQWDKILDFSSNSLGYHKRVLTDFNKLFRVKMTVTGGNAEVALAIAVFDNAMTTRIENAEIDVQLSHMDQPHRPFDSVRLGDKNNVQAVFNPDGSFNVNIVNAPGQIPENVISKFNETPAVGSGIETLIIGYTVPAAKSFKLQRIEFSGQNIGDYTVYLNGDKFAKKHTWFNGPMNGEFSFVGTSEEGPTLEEGDLIELKCIHQRPFSGSFTGRIQGIEIG